MLMPETTAFSDCARVWELTPSRRASSWLTRMRSVRIGSIQLKLMDCVRRIARHHGGRLVGELADFLRVRPADAVLQRPAHRRPQLQRREARHDLGELLAEHPGQARAHALACREALGDDDDLREEVVRQLHVQRQVEAHRALADVAATSDRCPASACSSFSKRVVDPLARIDRGAARERQVDQQLRTVRCREELLRHQRSASTASSSSATVAADGSAPRGAWRAPAAAEAPEDRAGLHRAVRHLVAAARATPISGANTTATTQEVSSAMVTTANIEKVYSPGGALGEADGHEAGRGDQRAGEHREGGRGVREGRGTHLVHALPRAW